ncbi:MAG TPA: glucose-6-phosphate isomerase [Gemmatimonadaceae bacterium]|nr:glucose-6-phosphate isomerase [Gemmatimonadaceae bacterium]
MGIRIDYTNMMAERLRAAEGAADARVGIDDAAWARGKEAFAAAYAGFERRQAAGELGFVALADGSTLAAEIRQFADGAGQAFSDIVVLGIGGSALGTIALRSALRPPHWNALSDEERDFYPRLHVLENVDPVTIAALLDRLELGRTLFLVISKSGGTAETMAQYLIVRGRLESALGDGVSRHLVFITDPEKGALRAIARKEGIAALDVPPNVGGRFSVLSAVGLLPAALVGVEIEKLLAGARDMLARCRSAALEENPAGVFATLQWLADTTLGLHTQVLMPYSDPLRELSAWWVQLWAESLGKIRPDGGHVGPTPLPALGATDQHSQVQLFMEGPRDKTVTFVALAESPVDLEIPRLHGDLAELAYLGGHSLAELLNAERQATAAALAQRGRANMTITIDRLDAEHLGGLLMLLEVATVYAGELYGVNPLDQPGVELGKRYTYALMGRPDAAEARREWESIPRPERLRTV